MNILIVSAVFPPEPVVSANLSYDLALALSIKHRVTAISPRPSRPLGFEFSNIPAIKDFQHINSTSYICPKSNLFGRFYESFSFGKWCSNYINGNHKSIDLIYANTWPLFAQYFLVKAAKKFNIPLVLHIQDVYPESLITKLPVLKYILKYLLLPIEKYNFKNSAKIVAISEGMKEYLVSTRKILSNKFLVVHNWQNSDKFEQFKNSRKENAEKSPYFTFMYLGNIGPVAGIDLLIDAFNLLKGNNCRLVIAGSGSMKERLVKKVDEMDCKNIEFWNVPEGKVPETQNFADVLLLPIKKGAAGSSIPSKLPAYMFSAKAIIASVDSESDTGKAIRNANCGWVIEPGNSMILSQSMSEVLEMQPSHLNEIGENGYRFAMNNFLKEKNLNKLIEAIENGK